MCHPCNKYPLHQCPTDPTGLEVEELQDMTTLLLIKYVINSLMTSKGAPSIVPAKCSLSIHQCDRISSTTLPMAKMVPRTPEISVRRLSQVACRTRGCLRFRIRIPKKKPAPRFDRGRAWAKKNPAALRLPGCLHAKRPFDGRFDGRDHAATSMQTMQSATLSICLLLATLS